MYISFKSANVRDAFIYLILKRLIAKVVIACMKMVFNSAKHFSLIIKGFEELEFLVCVRIIIIAC